MEYVGRFRGKQVGVQLSFERQVLVDWYLFKGIVGRLGLGSSRVKILFQSLIDRKLTSFRLVYRALFFFFGIQIQLGEGIELSFLSDFFLIICIWELSRKSFNIFLKFIIFIIISLGYGFLGYFQRRNLLRWVLVGKGYIFREILYKIFGFLG